MRHLVVGVAAVLVIIAILVFSITRQNNKAPGSSPTLGSISPKSNTADDAVLTIVGLDRKGAPVVQGSGFILTPDGLGGTNYHVLRETASAVAECCNGRVFEIRAIEGVDLVRDLVVFQLYDRGATAKPQGLSHVTLGSSKDAVVGEKVIAIGSPQGLENTVSDGIVSAIREDESIRYLQITAPISPGSSGGPVLGPDGQMIGIATSQLSEGQNLNFAVAVEYLLPLLDEHYEVSLSDFQSIVGTPAHSQRDQRATANAEAAPPTQETGEVQFPSLSGTFTGIVHNESVNKSADFGIVVTDDDGTLSGCMAVDTPLFGSGPLTGITAYSSVSFVVTSAVGKISFSGERNGKDISGWYTVEGAAPPTQLGTFTLHKSGSKSLPPNFDTANCPTDAEVHK